MRPRALRLVAKAPEDVGVDRRVAITDDDSAAVPASTTVMPTIQPVRESFFEDR